MARPVSHDAALRARLIETASALVDREGPERVSLRDVARAAETSTTAVYSLFGGKADLLAAVIEDAFASFGRQQAETEPQGLRALGVAYRAWALAHPDRYRLMFGGTIEDVDEKIDPSCTRSALVPLVRTLAGSGEVDADAALRDAVAVWAQVHGAVSLELAGVAPPSVDADAVYEAVLDAILAAHPGR